MHLFALSEENIICRNFAPLYDIDEEALLVHQTVR